MEVGAAAVDVDAESVAVVVSILLRVEVIWNRDTMLVPTRWDGNTMSWREPASLLGVSVPQDKLCMDSVREENTHRL